MTSSTTSDHREADHPGVAAHGARRSAIRQVIALRRRARRRPPRRSTRSLRHLRRPRGSPYAARRSVGSSAPPAGISSTTRPPKMTTARSQASWISSSSEV